MSNVIDLNTKPCLYVMVGLPGSGKSTFAHQELKGCVICSSDELRRTLFGDENDQSHNDVLFITLHKQIMDNLLEGKSVVYDATNLTLKNRHATIDIIKHNINCSIVAVLMATPIDICLINNDSRQRKVPHEVIYNMVRKFQMPMLSEGFDQIQIAYPFASNEAFKSDYFIDRMKGFDQHNPHHGLTLGMHCKMCAEFFNNKEQYDLAEIALYHDIGKLYTQTFDDNGNAHYYGHENYGAYLSLFIEHSPANKYFTEVINYHMLPFQLKNASEKTINKYKWLLGDTLWDKINEFHIGDTASR